MGLNIIFLQNPTFVDSEIKILTVILLINLNCQKKIS